MITTKPLTLAKSGLFACALAASMLVVPTTAQVNNNTTSNAFNGNTNAPAATTTRVVERDDTDWGWAGLLGLLGLAGLLKKPAREVVVQRDNDPNVRRT